MAIYAFHKTGSRLEARKYLKKQLDDARFNNERERTAAFQNLDRYIQWFAADQPVVVRCRFRIRLPLAPGVELSGEIPRIDVKIDGDGYRAVLVGYGSRNWERQLRIPLIQRAVANQLQRDESLVSVGVQGLDGTELSFVGFSKRELDESHREARELSAQATRMLGA